jgi:hypothetical protein
MAETITIQCGKCKKAMNVPGKLAGKTIRCKGCDAPVRVPADDGPLTLKADTPAADAKPKGRFEDEDDGQKMYGMTKDDLDLVRCAFCAQVLDPPDARICKSCGYDMRERRRHASKAVIENTFGDYLSHHTITIVAFVTILVAIGLDIWCLVNVDEWFEGSIFEQDEKDPTTGKKKFWVGPGLAKVWITIFLMFVCWYAGRFIYRMLATNAHPTERLLKE